MEARFDNCTLCVVDDEAPGKAIEKLECSTMAAQPGSNFLVGDDLSVLVPAVGKGHNKGPGGDDLPGIDIDDRGAFAKIHLSGFTGFKVQDRGKLRVISLELGQKAAHTGVATLETIFAYKGGVDGGSLDTVLAPGGDFIAIRLHQGGQQMIILAAVNMAGKLCIHRKGKRWVHPAMF